MTPNRLALPLFLVCTATASCNDFEPFKPPARGSVEVNVSVLGQYFGPSDVDVELFAQDARFRPGIEVIRLTRRTPLIGPLRGDLEPGKYRVWTSTQPFDQPWPSECRDGTDPPEIQVIAGRTSALFLTVTCTRLGYVRVRNVTAPGPDVDPDGYFVYLPHLRDWDGWPLHSARVTPNGEGTIGPLSAGSHSIWIDDLAPNCELTHPPLNQVQLQEGATVDYVFEVHCATLRP
jgi:hypothetical protein